MSEVVEKLRVLFTEFINHIEMQEERIHELEDAILATSGVVNVMVDDGGFIDYKECFFCGGVDKGSERVRHEDWCVYYKLEQKEWEE